MDANFAKFLLKWAYSGGKESACGQLLPMAEACGVTFGNATTHRGRVTVLGQRLSEIREQRLLIGDQALTVRYASMRSVQFYKIESESIGVRLPDDFSTRGAILTRLDEVERRLSELEAATRKPPDGLS